MALLLTHRVDQGVRLINLDSGKTLDVIVKSIDRKSDKVKLVLKEPENPDYYGIELIKGTQLKDLHYFPGLNIGIGYDGLRSSRVGLIYELNPSIDAIRANYSPNNDFLGYDAIKSSPRR